MTRDMFDDLLDRSAPMTRAADDAALARMIREARSEAVPRRRRMPSIALGVSIAAVLVGGAGVAVATDGLSWAPWAQDPVGAVSFTMPNGFDCELRFSPYSGGSDPGYVAEANRVLEEWYRSTDVVAEAEALLPAMRRHLEALHAESDPDPEADMAALTPEARADEIAHRAWSAEWMTWEWVVGDLEAQALRDAGFTVPDDRFGGSERAGQIQCFDEDGEIYAPGAGS
ncbi:hypothetical protein [Microbacterium sp. 2FI]|uniref:hypothetical protein n=1 Tax=Microbacterium sp. 2FI TaxID=2502193 RepID=UPI0010F75675|nr:hypothetical protein [Microbacterium sp. 2FI]